CGREYEYACKVRDGIIEDTTYFPLIYELPKDADWSDENNWGLANPTLGDIVRIDKLRAARDRALKQPTEQTKFRRLQCNHWVNSKDIWLQLMKWDACSCNRSRGIRPMAA